MVLGNVSGDESKIIRDSIREIIRIINSNETKISYETDEMTDLIDELRSFYFQFEVEFIKFIKEKNYACEIDLRTLLRKISSKLDASIVSVLAKKDKYTEILEKYIEIFVEFFGFYYNKITLIDLEKVQNLNPPDAFHFYYKELKDNFRKGNYLTSTILLGIITELLILDFINILIPNWEFDPNKLATDFADEKSISEKIKNLLKCVNEDRKRKYKKIKDDADAIKMPQAQIIKMKILKSFNDFESVINKAHMTRMKRNIWVHPNNFSTDNIPDKKELISDIALLIDAWSDILKTKEILEILYT